ncbi:MAG: GxxExxY protein [Gammaproteobacteria bacterium]|nr:GxxExxY protein [Gammaproteobacteria bacterium]
MDLLDIIKTAVDRFPDGYKNSGIDAVILHIERAERYFRKAKEENDEIMFTDVIYRTNQAFEGALKEAYSILASKDPSKKTPREIEQYLENGKILKDRVIASLTNYRKEWRNTSTHDYKLFFTEQEALLAIASVSTFCIILLEQIITKANENYERERAKSLSKQVIDSIDNYNDLPFDKKVFSLLSKSYEFMHLPDKKSIKEYEYLGLLSGFIEAVDPSITVESDVRLNGESGERADLILSSDNKKVLVEIKRSSLLRHYGDKATGQVLHYMKISKINHGVLMIFDENSTKGVWHTQQTIFGDGPYVTYINPIE